MGLLGKADLAGNGKKTLERGMPQIDHFVDAVLGNQAVEQSHLPVGGGNVGHARTPWQKLREGAAAAGIEVEGLDRATLLHVKIDEQASQQRLADSRTRRGDDGDGMAKGHWFTRSRASICAGLCQTLFRREAPGPTTP